MKKTEFRMENWDKRGRYEFGVGVGYYFGGFRRSMRGGVLTEVPVPPEKQIGVFLDLLRLLSRIVDEDGTEAPFLVVSDCSPIEVDSDLIMDAIGDHPKLFTRLPKNLGCGGKDNVLQKVLGDRCDYVLRVDADVRLDDFSLEDLRTGFKKLPDAWAITSCITYYARLAAASLPPDQRWFASANIADLVAFRSSIFSYSGYSDPDIRNDPDAEQRLRMLGGYGMKCYTDRKITGKAPPTGGNATAAGRVKIGEHIAKTRPFIRVVFPKNEGTPRLVLNKSTAHTANGFIIPAHPYAKRIAAAAWENS